MIAGVIVNPTSVGTALINEDFTPIINKQNGKPLFFSNVFERAETAADRRAFRGGRRLRNRTSMRVKELRSILEDKINEEDPKFFTRLDNCNDVDYRDGYYGEKNTHFSDRKYNDKDYHAEFPTIYHLIKYMRSEDVTESRFYRFTYLTLKWFMENRGHGYFTGSVDVSHLDNSLITAIEKFNALTGRNIATDFDNDKFEKLLCDRSIKNTDKKKALMELLGAEKSTEDDKFVGLLIGAKVALKDLFQSESDAAVQFSKMDDVTYDAAVSNVDGTERFILDAARAVYSWSVFQDLMRGFETYEDVKIHEYETYEKQVKVLKTLVKRYMGRATVDELFFCGEVSSEGFNEIYEQLVKKVDKEDADFQWLSSFENRFVKPRRKENAIKPYQIVRSSLVAVLDNLSEQNSVIDSNKDKILKIFDARLPYWVGPLDTASPYSWLVKKPGMENFPIRVWNWEEAVDQEKTSIQYMNKLIGGCTYLTDEKVLAKDTVLYSKFTILNIINVIRINDKLLGKKAKADLYAYFTTGKGVSYSGIKRTLIKGGYMTKEDVLTGIDNTYKASFPVFAFFGTFLDSKILTEKEVDDIVEKICCFRENDMIESYLKKTYPQLSDAAVSDISKLTFSGWGKLSRKFLDGITANGKDHVIDLMMDKNLNLPQILALGFEEAVNNLNPGVTEVTHELLDTFYLSPAEKRGVWKALKLMDFAVEKSHRTPSYIVVNSPRLIKSNGLSNQDKKNILISKYEGLCKTYKKDKDKLAVFTKLLEKLIEQPVANFKNERVVLYFYQMGRDMYTGEEIDLENVLKRDERDLLWNTEHIVPASYRRDDSIDNKCLISRALNKEKSNSYPLDTEIFDKMKGFWFMLREYGLLSAKKLSLLLRREPLTDEEIASDISRYLDTSSSISKCLRALLEIKYPNAVIINVKDGLIRQFTNNPFRKPYVLNKDKSYNQELADKLKAVRFVRNEISEAQQIGLDAYIASVAGYVYFKKYGAQPFLYVKNKRHGNRFNIRRTFDYNIIRNDKVVWDVEESIFTIKNIYNKTRVGVTYLSYENDGSLSDIMFKPKSDGNFMRIKRDMPTEKYGSWGKNRYAYSLCLDIEGNRNIVPIPIYVNNLSKEDEGAIDNYLSSLGYANYTIEKKLRLNDIMYLNGSPVAYRGKIGASINTASRVYLRLSEHDSLVLKRIRGFYNSFGKNSTADENLPEKDELKNELNRFYMTLVQKMAGKIYRGIIRENYYVHCRNAGFEMFKSLSDKDKAFVILEMIKLFKNNNEVGDLHKIGLKGVTTMSVSAKPKENVEF